MSEPTTEQAMDALRLHAYQLREEQGEGASVRGDQLFLDAYRIGYVDGFKKGSESG